MNATGQALKHFGFDEAEPDLITGGGQPMIQFMGSIGFDNAGPQNLMNDSVTSGGVTMDVDDDLGFSHSLSQEQRSQNCLLVEQLLPQL